MRPIGKCFSLVAIKIAHFAPLYCVYQCAKLTVLLLKHKLILQKQSE